MRTTVDIDDTALAAVRQIAVHSKQSLGQVVSDLILKALRDVSPPKTRNGFPVFDRSRKTITLRDVKQADGKA